MTDHHGAKHRHGKSGGVNIRGGRVNVGGSIVGRDLILQLRDLPRSAQVALLVVAGVAVGFLALQLAGYVPAVRAYVYGPDAMPEHEFNVVVTPFGFLDGDGKLVASVEGIKLSKDIYQRIDTELKELRNEGVDAQVTYDETHMVRNFASAPGVLQGPNIPNGLWAHVFGPREDTADHIAKSMNAKLVVYGNVSQGDGLLRIQPAFYIQGLSGAEELLGESYLGTAIPTQRGSNPALNRIVGARTEALTAFTIGLDYLFAGRPELAVQWFDRAKSAEGWDDTEGKWVAYLFSGNTHYQIYSANRNDNASQLDKAEQDYLQAQKLARAARDDYARAYIGLGNIYYERFIRSDPKDPSQLDLAVDQYRQASAATDKPKTAYVDQKLHVTMGNTYLVKAQFGEPELFNLAQGEYEQVVHEYEQRPTPDLRELAARSYCGLAAVNANVGPDLPAAQRLAQACVQAANGKRDILRDAAQVYCALGVRADPMYPPDPMAEQAYTQCLANAGSDQQLAQSAQDGLDRLKRRATARAG